MEIIVSWHDSVEVGALHLDGVSPKRTATLYATITPHSNEEEEDFKRIISELIKTYPCTVGSHNSHNSFFVFDLNKEFPGDSLFTK